MSPEGAPTEGAPDSSTGIAVSGNLIIIKLLFYN